MQIERLRERQHGMKVITADGEIELRHYAILHVLMRNVG